MTKLISVSELVKSTWSVYRSKFKLFAGLMAAPFLVMAVGRILTSLDSSLVSLISALVGIVGLVLAFWSSASMVVVLRDRAGAISYKDAYRLSLSKLLPMLWVSILTMFIVGGGFFLLVIPGLVLMFWLLFATILVIAENERGMNAIIKSREYVRNYFWPIVGRYILMSVVFLVVYGVLTKIANWSDYVVLNSLLEAVVNILIVPIPAIYAYLVYESLKQVKSSVSIDPTKKQALRYLLVGLFGSIVAAVVMVLAVVFSLFAWGTMAGIMNNSLTNNPNLKMPDNLPTGLTAEQQKQLEEQMEAVKKMQEQLKSQMPANLSIPTE